MSYSIPKNLLDINSSNSLLLEDGSRTNPAISFDSQTDMGITRSANFQLGLVAGLGRGAVVGTSYIHIGASSYYAWRTADLIGQGTGSETRLRRDDKGILGITTYDDSPTGLNLYNTYTDASNYERLEVKWDSDYAVIATAANGTGSNRTIQTSNLEIRGRTSTTETYLSLKRDNDTSVITVQSNGAGVTRIQGDHTFDVTTDTTTGTLSLGNYNGRHGVQITNEGYNVGIGRVVPAVNGVTIGRSEHPVMLNGSGTFIYNNNNVDETNYERLEFKWDTNVATIDSTAAGSGTARSFDISYNGSRRFRGDSAFSYIYQANGTYLAFGSNDFKPQQDSTIELGSTGSRWLNTYTDTITIGGGVDAVLTADAAYTLALRNGTNAQQFNIYNTYTDASNYERLEIGPVSNTFRIKPHNDGTGSDRTFIISGADTSEGNIEFQSDGKIALRYGEVDKLVIGVGYIQSGGSIVPVLDSGRELGTTTLRWGNTYTDTITIGNGVDAVLTADAADTLALRNGTNAQQFNIYNTYTDASNYERLEIKWDSNIAKIFNTADGSGSVRSLEVGLGTARIAQFSYSGTNFDRKIFPVSNNSTDIGTTSLRWANIYSVNGNFSGDLAISGAEKKLVLQGQSSAFDTTSGAASTIYQSDDDGGSYPFTSVGNLILQSRQNSSKDIVFVTGSVPAVRMVVASAGNVGIGINVPTSPLHVVGNIHNTGTITTDGGFADLLAVSGTSAPELRINSTDSVIFDGDEFGRLQWYMNDANANGTGATARISAIFNDTASGSPAQQTAGEGTDLVFSTGLVLVTGQTQTVTEKLRIDKNGTFKHAVGTNSYWYNLDTDASNYERLEIKWDSNIATIGATGDGTGTARQVRLGDSGTNFTSLAASNQVKVLAGGNTLFVGLSTQIQFYKTILPNNDATAALGTTTKRWSNTYTDNITIGDGVDAVLTADANYQFDMRNGTNPNSLNIYNTYTDASNYERLEIKWDSDVATIECVSAGSGSARPFNIKSGGEVKLFTSAGEALRLGSVVRVNKNFYPLSDSAFECGRTTQRWSNTFTDKITIGNGTDAILNGDGTGKIYMGNDSSQLTQFAVRGEDDGAGNYNQLEMRMASNGACGLYSTGYGTQTPSGLSIYHNGTKAFEFTSTQLYIHKPFRPTSAGSEPLGTSSVPFGNLYINTSSKIYFNNAQLLGSRGGSGIVLEQRNGTTEQRYYLYNTYTDDNNYERLEMKWDTNVAYIENTNNGSGALRELYIGSNSQGNIRFGASGNIIRFSIGNFSATKMYLNSSGLTLYGNYLPQGNGTRSIGSDSARFKKAYINGMLSGTETFTATDTLDDQNQVCLCNATSGNITLNLPVASSSIAGTQYQIKKIDSSSNTVIITPNSGAGDLIDGSATYTLSNQWEGAIIVCDGADWFITGGVTNSGGGGGGGGGLGGGD